MPYRNRVLVVDDDPISRITIRTMLQRHGYHAIEASDGREAWDILQETRVGYVIADWMMPELDGIGLCRLIRQRPVEAGYVYIILLTSRSGAEDRQMGMEAGADDFLAKPPNASDLVARLNVAKRIVTMQLDLQTANEALEEKRRIEMEVGGTIQRALLMSRPPALATRFDFAAMNLPSGQIDGDFCDFYVHSPSVVDLVVGDAMGKGVPAALMGAGAKSFILRAMSSLLARRDPGDLPAPKDIVQIVADGLARPLMRLSSFVTLDYVRLDADAGTATFVDAGHPQALHLSPDGGTKLIGGRNFPIGFVVGEPYEQTVIPMDRRDLLCFYSDGVTEARSPSGELFGVERMRRLLATHVAETPSQLLFRLRESVRDFVGHHALDDDFTVVMVRFAPPSDDWTELHETFSSDLASLAEVRLFIDRVATASRLSDRAREEVVLATHELVTNIVRHAHRGWEDEQFEIMATRPDEGALGLSFSYNSDHYDPPVSDLPEITTDTEGGMGLFIIQQLLDEVEYVYDAERQRMSVNILKRG